MPGTGRTSALGAAALRVAKSPRQAWLPSCVRAARRPAALSGGSCWRASHVDLRRTSQPPPAAVRWPAAFPCPASKLAELVASLMAAYRGHPGTSRCALGPSQARRTARFACRPHQQLGPLFPLVIAQAAHPAAGRSRSTVRCAKALTRSVLAFGCAPHAASGLAIDPSLTSPRLVRGTAIDSGERWISRSITS
jgi:hypothetical protein